MAFGNITDIEIQTRLYSLFHILMETDFDTIFYNALTLKPIPFETIFSKHPIALVGNDASITKHTFGNTINKMNTVIRFHPFEITNYESHVGKKTSIIVVNDSMHIYHISPDIIHLFIHSQFLSLEEKRIKLGQVYGVNSIPFFILFHNPELSKNIQHHLQYIPDPSVLLLILVGIRFKDVHMFGFTHQYIPHNLHYLKDVKTYPSDNVKRDIQIYKLFSQKNMIIHHGDPLLQKKIKVLPVKKKIEEKKKSLLKNQINSRPWQPTSHNHINKNKSIWVERLKHRPMKIQKKKKIHLKNKK